MVGDLGQGGFGKVYLAYDDFLKRHVAVKVPKPGLIRTPKQFKSFLEEARIAAGLRHKSIVAVYDVGAVDETMLYVVLEYIEGKTLSWRLRRDRPPLEELIGILAEVAEAIHYAHSKRLVHRDLKPSNILLDLEGRPHVADFGLAVGELSPEAFSGRIEGTPAYMAPEQIRGEWHRLSPRTDVWAIGVMLYEILADRDPFPGSEHEQILASILQVDPDPPSKIAPGVPVELENICLKCLSKRHAGSLRDSPESRRRP